MPSTARFDAKRRTPMLRWASVALRTLHLCTVIGLGAALLGAPLAMPRVALGVAVTGIATMGLDLWVRPWLFSEWSGLSLLMKLAAVTWLAVDPRHASIVFWFVVAWSTVFAHAPASFRHARWRAGDTPRSGRRP
jgi:hypothetical protein